MKEVIQKSEDNNEESPKTNGNLSMEDWKVEMAKKFIQRSIFNDNYEELNEKQNDDAMKEVIQKSEDNNEESPRIKKEYSSITQVEKIRTIRPQLRRVKTVHSDTWL